MRRVLYALLVVPVLVSVWLLLPAQPQAATTHDISIEASQYEFVPGRIEVAQGDEVIITLTAADVVHGLYLDGYGIQQRVEPGVSQQIRFTADQPGKFRYRCLVSCGSLHPFMLGELVVNSNIPFRQSLAVLLLSLTAAFIYFARFWRNNHEQYSQSAVA